jgi:Iap family predicted aminopeptidase
LGVGNGYNSFQSVVDSKNEMETSKTIITQLQEKRLIDSIEIDSLKKLSLVNVLKSDSIKLAVVDNAVKALESQRMAIERDNQNSYLHMQKEIEDNLLKSLRDYEEMRIIDFGDSTFFTSTRLNNVYLRKFGQISSSRIIIEFLLETSDEIDKVNEYADAAANSTQTNTKNVNIRMFLKHVKIVQEKLYQIYFKTLFSESYKEFDENTFPLAITQYQEKRMEENILNNNVRKKGTDIFK